MIKRSIEKSLQYSLKHFPVVILLGPRQVGKTTLAKQLAKSVKKASLYFDMELNSDYVKFDDAESFLRQHQDKLIIIDEVQRRPELFALLRALVDIKRVPARFILLGSANPQLVKGVSETLAGRALYAELSGIGLDEIPKSISLKKHWTRGGFPQSLLAKNELVSRNWLNSYITSYVEKELNNAFGIEFTASVVRRFWSMLSANHGGIWNASDYARSMAVSPPTATRYLDYLEGAYLVRKLQPFFPNVSKRLVKAPKVYIRDSGLLHALLRIGNYDDLYNTTFFGSSWEGYVIEQINSAKPSFLDLYYYRTHNGAEVDLVLVNGHKPVATVEIKTSQTAKLSVGYYESTKDLQTKHNFVVFPDGDSYYNSSKVLLLNLQDFIANHLPKLK
ncbi:MAG: ATP-binding protein [Bacteroidota bacterium]|nr:ATP-binding protein [Bacteroidota bacterium]